MVNKEKVKKSYREKIFGKFGVASKEHVLCKFERRLEETRVSEIL